MISRAGRLAPAAAAALVLNLALFAVAALLASERPLKFEMSDPVPVSLVTLKPPTPPAPEEETPPEPRPEPEPRQDFVPAPSLPAPSRPDLPSIAVSLDLGPISVDAPRGDFIFNADDLDQPPREVARTHPIYPFKARQRNIEGKVQVKFLVGADGAVSRVEVLSAEPKGVFETSVLQAVPNWRFEPGRLDGRAVPAWVVTEVFFQVER
jgi:protein TonB